MPKYFVSCIIPSKQLGAIQLEAEDEAELKPIVEEMAPERCAFRAYVVDNFDEEIPIGEFVDAKTLKQNGY